MSEPLDDLYIEWLYRQVLSVKYVRPSKTYWSLFKHLYSKEFVWLVPNDDNRVEDGRNLRYEFADEQEVEPSQDWLDLGCSMLEMLIALARRLAFETEDETRGWFWEFLENLDLRQYTDARYSPKNPAQVMAVDDILDAVIWRTYASNGEGGLFPLESPDEDQRKIELWYQQSRYLLERS